MDSYKLWFSLYRLCECGIIHKQGFFLRNGNSGWKEIEFEVKMHNLLKADWDARVLEGKMQ
jgi:hypothetical protein